ASGRAREERAVQVGDEELQARLLELVAVVALPGRVLRNHDVAGPEHALGTVGRLDLHAAHEVDDELRLRGVVQVVHRRRAVPQAEGDPRHGDVLGLRAFARRLERVLDLLHVRLAVVAAEKSRELQPVLPDLHMPLLVVPPALVASPRTIAEAAASVSARSPAVAVAARTSGTSARRAGAGRVSSSDSATTAHTTPGTRNAARGSAKSTSQPLIMPPTGRTPTSATL